jgi:hypothetical protein
MSVILSRHDWKCLDHSARCGVCGEGLWPPFALWHAETELYFCSRCCANLRTSLMADLIQVTAIRELQQLGYGSHTVERKRIKEVEEADKTEAKSLPFLPPRPKKLP